MKPLPKKDAQALAHHEAGHAVIALTLGMSIEKLTIVPERSDLKGLPPGWILGSSTHTAKRRAVRVFVERADGAFAENTRGKRLVQLAITRDLVVSICAGPESEIRYWMNDRKLTRENAASKIFVGSGGDQAMIESLMTQAFGRFDRRRDKWWLLQRPVDNRKFDRPSLAGDQGRSEGPGETQDAHAGASRERSEKIERKITMAHIYKRKTSTGEIRYQSKVFAGKDPNGRNVMLVETFGTKKEASNWAHDREKERGDGTLVVNQCAMATLLDDLDRYYKIRKKSPWGPVVVKAHLRPYFGAMRADQVTTATVENYIAHRQARGRKDSTINRELSVLLRAFKIGQLCTPPKVSRVPRMPHLQESEPRQGFFEDHEYRALLAALPEEIRPVLTFTYYTGARKAEMLDLRWDQVNLELGMVRLNAEQTKAKTARTIPLTGDVIETLRMQRDIRDRWHPSCPYVFFRHATGKRLINFDRAWWNACKSAGLWDATAGKLDKNGLPEGAPTKILHDNRRTAVRNLTRAGNTEAVAMRISGHKTASVFRRYNIVSEADLAEAARKLGAHIDSKRASVTPVAHDTQESVPNRLN